MAICPFAEVKLLPVGSSDPAIIPVGGILHVDAGNATDLYSFFKDRSGGIESHFHIRKDGYLYQYRDTGREADANYKANSFIKNGKRYGFVSIETQGLASGFWTPSQFHTIKRLLTWLHETHDIPLKVCDGPQSPGIGYHTLFGSPSSWTPVAKSCPGPDRIKQFNSQLVPWMKESGMAFTDEDRKVLRNVESLLKKHSDQFEATRKNTAERDRKLRQLVKKRFNATDADLDAIMKEVSS